MQDSYKIKVPAKINLFLNVLNKRNDGFHNISSGITFVNLFDEIRIKRSDNMKINFLGKFKPNNNYYANCIISKTLNYLNLKNKINLEINIKKNIPTQAGLGSASVNAAGLILGLAKMKLITIKDNIFYSSIGADVPVCLFGKNAIITGIGEQIEETDFPKYYFLLVKPNINLSTQNMYKKLSENIKFNFNKKKQDDVNDFEKIAIFENQEIKKILEYLKGSSNAIFSRMTGSGSCCYAVYKNLEYAVNAKEKFNIDFPDLWTFVCENNVESL